jgi:hypothetical protein
MSDLPDVVQDHEFEEDWDDLKPSHPFLEGAPKEELVRLVRGLCDGAVFTSAHLEAANQLNMLGMVFLPISLGGLSRMPKRDIEKIGVFYEYLDKAGPMGISGYPCFFSVHILNKEDWEKVRVATKREDERRKVAEEEMEKEFGSRAEDCPKSPTQG